MTMAQVNMPIRRQSANQDQQLFQIGGAILGGMSGGPSGALAGANMGGQVAGMVSPQQEQSQPQAIETAMTRRTSQLAQTPLSQIRDSIDSLKYIKDDGLRAELAKPLLQADYMAKREGQV